MTCAHAQNGLCLVSTALAGTHVPLDERACAACVWHHPQFVNDVTYSRAIYTLRTEGRNFTGLLKKMQGGAEVRKPRQDKAASKHSRVMGWISLFRKQGEGVTDAAERLLKDAKDREVGKLISGAMQKCKCSQKPALKKKEAGLPDHWMSLHKYPVSHFNSWDEAAAGKWFSKWCDEIPAAGCECRQNWAAYVKENPPALMSPREFFRWTVDAHNYVSTNHVKPGRPEVHLSMAEKIHKVPWIDNVHFLHTGRTKK